MAHIAALLEQIAAADQSLAEISSAMCELMAKQTSLLHIRAELVAKHRAESLATRIAAAQAEHPRWQYYTLDDIHKYFRRGVGSYPEIRNAGLYDLLEHYRFTTPPTDPVPGLTLAGDSYRCARCGSIWHLVHECDSAGISSPRPIIGAKVVLRSPGRL